MKVLYISPLDDTGYGTAARNTILSLDAAGVDVVPRPLALGGKCSDLEPRIQELLSKSTAGVTHVVQHTLPEHWVYQGGLRNVGFFHLESQFHPPMKIGGKWESYISMMDELWTSSDYSYYRCMAEFKRSTQVYRVNVGVDPEYYTRPYPQLPFRQVYPNDFIFYWVGELRHRKNLAAVIRAFHAEFSVYEPVQMLIKTDQPVEVVDQWVQHVKQGMRIYKDIQRYKKEIIVTEHLSKENMGALHTNCDCFVTASHGEGWCLPFWDSVFFGKTPIFPRHVVDVSVPHDSIGYSVQTVEDYCYGAVDTMDGLYTGRETWKNVSSKDIGWMMRWALRESQENGGQQRQSKVDNGKALVGNYSHAVVGANLKAILDRSAA